MLNYIRLEIAQHLDIAHRPVFQKYKQMNIVHL
jgi:hypothetical protein